jgi:hypothetical protein
MKSSETLQTEINSLARRLRAAYFIFGAILLAQFVFFFGTKSEASIESVDTTDKVIKARGLIIVDEQGRERVIMGAPVPDPPKEGKRINQAHGMIILDPEGYERFGLGLMDNGNMGMGFDAPRGKGDDRNRERINIIADSQGGAMIRFLNRKTGIPGWLRLGDDDNLYLEFLDVQPANNKVIRRRIGFKGEETVEEPFKK